MFPKYIYVSQVEYLFVVLLWMSLTLYKNFPSCFKIQKQVSIDILLGLN